MGTRRITVDLLNHFIHSLEQEERCTATIEKYRRDVRAFCAFLPEDKLVSKDVVLAYKQELGQKYKVTSANSMLVALNRLWSFLGWEECRVKLYKVQRRCFRDQSRELTRPEYLRLVRAAKSRNRERLSLLLQTICSTGIRVSEHRFITVETVRAGRASVSCKGKLRTVFLPAELRRLLLRYCKKQGLVSGPIFISRTGRPLDRSAIWAEMKALSELAHVAARKIFPHNLRHLFAVTFYQMEKDIVRLADFLGHASIDTTRIYTCTSGEEHVRTLSRLGLVACLP